MSAFARTLVGAPDGVRITGALILTPPPSSYCVQSAESRRSHLRAQQIVKRGGDQHGGRDGRVDGAREIIIVSVESMRSWRKRSYCFSGIARATTATLDGARLSAALRASCERCRVLVLLR